MTNEALLEFAARHGHEVIYEPLTENKSFSLNIGHGHIVMSKKLSGFEEKKYLAHEVGHCEYGGFYNKYSPYEIAAKAERRANKWAYYRLIPPGDVISAIKKGAHELWELAEELDVSCEYMQEALEYYRSVMVI